MRTRGPDLPRNLLPILVVGPHAGSGHRDRCQRLSSHPPSPSSRPQAFVKLATLPRLRIGPKEEPGSPGELGKSKGPSYLEMLFADEDVIGDSESAPSPTFSTAERGYDTDATIDAAERPYKYEKCPPTPLKGQCVQGSGTTRPRDGFVDDGVPVLSLSPSMGSPLVRIALVEFGRSPLDSQYPCSHPTPRALTTAPPTRRTLPRVGTRAVTTRITGMHLLDRSLQSDWKPYTNLDFGPPSRPRASWRRRTPSTSRATTQIHTSRTIPRPPSSLRRHIHPSPTPQTTQGRTYNRPSSSHMPRHNRRSTLSPRSQQTSPRARCF